MVISDARKRNDKSIKHCPICGRFLEAKSSMTYWRLNCKAAFHITIEYRIDSPCLIDDEGE